MGLFSFLREKFSRKKKENEVKQESTETYVKGLEKSRKNFASKLDNLSKRYKQVNEEYFEELEQILIEADVGVSLTLRIIDEALAESKAQKITEPKQINELVVDKMFVGYATKGDNITNEITFRDDGPTVLLVMGVNGVGKTTSIAKLAYRYISQGKKVMLCAADTFRAGAIEQLTVWAERLHCDIVKGKQDQDPASIAYDAAKKAKEC